MCRINGYNIRSSKYHACKSLYITHTNTCIFMFICFSVAPIPPGAYGDLQCLQLEEDSTHTKVGVFVCMGQPPTHFRATRRPPRITTRVRYIDMDYLLHQQCTKYTSYKKQYKKQHFKINQTNVAVVKQDVNTNGSRFRDLLIDTESR